MTIHFTMFVCWCQNLSEFTRTKLIHENIWTTKTRQKKGAIVIYNRLRMVASHPKVHHVHCLIHHHTLMAPDEFILSSSFFSCRKMKSSIHSFIYILLFFFSFQMPSDQILKPLSYTNDFMNYFCHLKYFLKREI